MLHLNSPIHSFPTVKTRAVLLLLSSMIFQPGDIPAKYISLENDIGKNKKGDKQYIERLRYIVDEIGNLDSDEMTDKEVEDYIRRLPISIRLQKDIVPYTNIIKWAQGELPIFED